MAERDYAAQPVADSLGLRDVIRGLAQDLQDMRAGKISPAEGQARAAVAKQIFNGVRLYFNAIRSLEAQARPVSDPKTIPSQEEAAENA